MKAMSRRRFLAVAAASAAATQLRGYAEPARITLPIPREFSGPTVPADFVGLSYEVQQLADPNFFSLANAGLIRAFQEISDRGVLRLGGNTSEFAVWSAATNKTAPERLEIRGVPGEPKARFYAVTPAAVVNLKAFLDAVGWNCIYGINMGTNTPARAAEEASFAARTLGDRLEYFQIGNEPDLYANHLRDPRTWNVAAYLDQWLRMARAVVAHVPGARLGLPDVAFHLGWLTYIADRWPAVKNQPKIAALTHHYYFGGPATNPAVNIPNLLSPETADKVLREAILANQAAAKMGVPVRMTEGNTCYRGGKPGVSDVFASALWAADYALLLAANRYAGVNLHGGAGHSVANSVGGFLPGDVLLREQGESSRQIAAHPHPFYTPIEKFGSEYVLEPVAYGLKFAGALRGATLSTEDFSRRLQASGGNATAYAGRLPDGRTSVVIVNKEADRDLELNLEFREGETTGVEIETLTAPALDSRRARITRPDNARRLERGRLAVLVPRASGMRITAG